MIGFISALLVTTTLIVYWAWQQKRHQNHINNIPLRIHVNGIRGKSTVTRIIAGMLREAGYETVAKTTGSAARVIHPDGSETPIQRWGSPSILEQVRIIEEHVTPQTDALVIECMAVNPTYQQITQHQIVQGNIGVITNVREDHQDVMGETLLEIADALSNTIPVGGQLITGEDRPELLARLAYNCESTEAQFLPADATLVADADLEGFSYLSFKENVAIGLEVARLLNIPRGVAIRGMQKAAPDVGAVMIHRRIVNGKELVWAPLFAVNDRESTIASVEAVKPYHQPEATRIGLLNNRLDRAVRALQFADIAALDLALDYVVTLGAYEAKVAERLIAQGFPQERILHLGNSVAPSLEQILTTITNHIDGQQAILLGMVNIHTEQAELLRHYFETPAAVENGRSTINNNQSTNQPITTPTYA